MEVLSSILVELFIIGGIIVCFFEFPKFSDKFCKLIEEEKYGGVEGDNTPTTDVVNNSSDTVKKDEQKRV